MELEHEQELVERAREDDAAFVTLYDFYFPKIYAYVYKRCGHQQTAEDVVSIAFTKVFTGLGTYDAKSGSFKAWVYRIATNVLIDHYRKQGRRPKEAEIPEGYDIEHKDAERADDRVDRKIDRGRIEHVLKQLPEKDQEVLQLKFFAELSNIEIAQALGISANNAGVRVYRSLKAFKKQYQSYVEA